MKTWIIANPSAGSAGEKLSRVRELAAGQSGLTLHETAGASHARELAMEAARQGVERVVAAGGDGTIHEVVQGLMAAPGRPLLGVIPLGTGNDLARTLGVPTDPAEAIALLDRGVARTVDLIRVQMNGEIRHAVNVAAGGFSGQVDEVLTDEMKAAWGPLAYVRGAIQALPDLTAYQTAIAWEDGELERIEALNIVVANGRTCAGGIQVAPAADPSDGLLDVVVVRYASLLDLASIAARLLVGDYTNSEEVSLRRARRVRIRSRPGMWFNVDGELIGNGPVTFEAVPAALTVIAPAEAAPAADAARVA